MQRHQSAISGVILLSLLGGAMFFRAWYANNGILWDLDAYSRGVFDYFAGIDPYRADVDPIFVCNPLVLRAFASLHSLVPLSVLFGGFYVVSFYFLHREIFKAVAPTYDHILVWIAGLCFGGAGVISSMAGNFTLFFHFAVVAAAIGMLQNSSSGLRRSVFSLLLFVLSCVKPYFLVYLTAYFGVYDVRRASLRSVLQTSGVALFWWLSALALPQEYAAFSMAIREQTFGKSDLGFSVFGILHHYVSNDRICVVVHLLVSGAFLVWCTHVARRCFSASKLDAWLILVPALVFANPRMKEYDFVIAVIAVMICSLRLLRDGGVHRWVPGVALSLVPACFRFVALLDYRLPRVCAEEHVWQIVGLIALVGGVHHGIMLETERSTAE